MAEPSGGNDQPILIRGATLIDGTGNPPLPNSAVLVTGDRIIAVAPTVDFGQDPDVQVIDAGGKWLLPGLIDAHAHIGHAADELAPLYPAFGVTTVRDTGGDLETLADIRSRIEDGSLRGPRLFYCGPIFDTPPAIHQGITVLVESDEILQEELDRIARAGVHATKIYVGIGPELAERIISASKDRGLGTIGDLHETSAAEAIRAGITGIEHSSSAYKDLVPEQERAPLSLMYEQGPAQWRKVWQRGLANVDGQGAEARAIASLIAESGVQFDPTLVVLERFARMDDSEVTHAPDVDLMPDRIRAGWVERADGRARSWSEEDYAMARRAFETLLTFTSEVRRQGGAFLVGTDAPNPFVVPGASLHREFELLVEAGMTPLDVLTATTSGNAAMLGIEQEVGTIAPGRVADLVLLDANPLDDIRNSRRISLVLQSGVRVGPAIWTEGLFDNDTSRLSSDEGHEQ